MPDNSVFQLPHSPVAALGTITLVIAFLVNGYSLAAALTGQRHARPGLVRSGLWATWAFAALMCLASALMVYAFLSHDFTIRYVAHYSDLSMPLFYKITAYWGGLDGSLMFWVWVLSMFTTVALKANHERHRDIIGYVIATIAVVQAFFLAVLLYAKNPFGTFMTPSPIDGQGLNPLLQNYWMVIHPPSLYLGYVGMTIPFAFCIGALASGRLDDAWLYSVRSWVIIAWFFLTLGLVLGMIWAYEELGWGGYWAWDPVENAGFLPWLTCTAFLHSVMIQERKGMLKVWNVVLMVTSFFLTIFGTFMTRSGVVQSVHAFGEDPQLAFLFILFMAGLLVVSFGLILHRLPMLQSKAQFESFFSREFAFLLNNWILLLSAIFVLFATMFPTLSESVTGTRISVAAPFFDKFMVPAGLLLLILMGAGPLFAWRHTTTRKLREQFLIPVVTGFVVTALVMVIFPRAAARSTFLIERIQAPVSLVCIGLIAFVMATIGQELAHGAKVRQRQTGGPLLSSLIGIVISKRRKYGGYVIHAGVALMFLGFAGKTYSREREVTLQKPGEVARIGDINFRYDDLRMTENPNHTQFTAVVTVSQGKGKSEKEIDTLYPARRAYAKGNGEITTEVALSRRIDRDIYIALNTFDPRTKVINLRLVVNPLVNWIWLGFAVLAVGTAIALLKETWLQGYRPSRAGQGPAPAEVNDD
jgi:cytochrome c-type biogenesis protein CcmF